MRRTLIATLALLLASIVGCSAGEAERSGADMAASTAESAPAMAGMEDPAAKGNTAAQRIVLERKIIYRGNVALDTESLDDATEKLEGFVKRNGGYISNASHTGSRGTKRHAEWTVRIPSENFDAFMKALPALGELKSSDRQAEDVSEEFYDVEARLRNKKVEEQRLLQLLQKAAGRLAEVLAVEKELTRVREEIERIEGRLRFLQAQTSFSTVTISITEVDKFEPAGPPSFTTQVSRAFSVSLGAMRDLGVAVALIVVVVLPWIVPLVLIAIIARPWIRSKMNRR